MLKINPHFSNSKITSLYLSINLLLLISTAASAYDFQGKITVEPKYIFVKYAHELREVQSGFHHSIDISVFNQATPSNCAKDDMEFCLQWSDFAKFQITKKNDQCQVYDLSTKLEKPLKIRFDIKNVHLYGGPEHAHQTWPADMIDCDKYAYVTRGEDGSGKIEPLWVVSNGMYLYVDQNTPLFISQDKNKGYFDLIASRESPYLKKSRLTQIKYTLCKLDNIKEATQHAIKNILGKPSGIPDEKMVRYPIWSTWAKYKSKVDTAIVMDFARQITESGLPNSQLEIDDAWETCYGSLTVDQGRFKDMKGLISELKKMGFRVTFWVHPFINLDCEPYHSEGVKNGYFVKNTFGSVNSKWWNGAASQIDFTNPEAKIWWQNRLKKLQAETGVDSFKFDAGESDYAPVPPVFHETGEDHPETNIKHYIQAAAEFGPMVEVRSGRGTQKHPIFVRMMDRESTWDGRLAFSTFIPVLLQMNILGYPFVLPDMVGGNGYHEEVSDEMFIRWLQANVFMPSIQFSYLPSDYGSRGVRLAKKFVDLHVQYADKIIEAMKNAVKFGTPVNPPIWWIDPTDPQTYQIDSEFLLGENILVAPVVQEGVQSRDIYLPKGFWKDEVNKDSDIIKGPVWLYNYPADIEVLPYFSRVQVDIPPSPPTFPSSHTSASPIPNKDDNKDHKKDEKSGAGIMLSTLSSILISLIFSKLFTLRF